MRSPRTARGNRLGLALVGSALLGPAGYALLRGTGRLSAPVDRDPLVSTPLRQLAATQGWFWPTVAAASGTVALLALRWLLVQARTGRKSRLVLEEDPSGATTVDARALASAAADEIEALPSMRKADVVFVDAPGPPRLRITVITDDTTDLDELRAGLLDVLAGLRQTLEPDTLPALIRLRPRGVHRPTRVA